MKRSVIVELSPEAYTKFYDNTNNRATHPDIGCAHIYEEFTNCVYMPVNPEGSEKKPVPLKSNGKTN